MKTDNNSFSIQFYLNIMGKIDLNSDYTDYSLISIQSMNESIEYFVFYIVQKDNYNNKIIIDKNGKSNGINNNNINTNIFNKNNKNIDDNNNNGNGIQ